MRAPAPQPLLRAALGAAVAFGAATAGVPAGAAAEAAVFPKQAEEKLALAIKRRAARDPKGALAAAREAAAAFDAQVELHKALSDALPGYDDARAERAAALALGLRRDEAFALVAELAEATGDRSLAVRHYVMLVQSQADQPRGREAYAALKRLGWAAAPVPGISPVPSSAPKP